MGFLLNPSLAYIVFRTLTLKRLTLKRRGLYVNFSLVLSHSDSLHRTLAILRQQKTNYKFIGLHR